VFENKPAANTVKINIVVTEDGRATTKPVAAKVYRSPNGKAFPSHWGAPPLRQTRDLRPLPGGYGAGSGTLARWIQENLNKDAANPNRGKGTAKPKPAPGNKQARIAALEKEIARMKDFARRARFTREGYQKHKAKLTALEKELAELKGGKTGGGKQTGVPTFEEWVKGGKKIPAGRIFTGGSPWFNESTGKRRTPEEVYKMLYGRKKPGTRPGIGIQPVRPRPGGRKPFPAHWGAPPRIQTRDLRPLPGGYGRGSGTLARWIQQNLKKDAANPNRGKSENTPAKPQSKRPALSPAFAAKHPGGSYATGELLVGVEKGLSKEDSEKMLAEAIPGLKIKKAMINNTILHVILPESTNVELAMAKLKTVKAVRYSELNGRVGIQPIRPGGPGIGIGRPRPQIQPTPGTPPRRVGLPAVQPRR
ncbi:uncharacterized protein METZ01_LOCUS270579, partial [marine metagenome]